MSFFDPMFSVDFTERLAAARAVPGHVLVDVRGASSFAEGHIPGAILIPHDRVKELAESVLTDKNQLILVYCRSGRRSKLAAEDLLKLGYTNIKEFGGILDWPYEVE